MEMSRNVAMSLDYQAMCFDNCVIHCALSMDIMVPKEFAWMSLWQ